MSNYIPAYVFKQAARREARRVRPKPPSIREQIELGILSPDEARAALYKEPVSWKTRSEWATDKDGNLLRQIGF